MSTQRYARQVRLAGFGEAGQKALANASVLVIGAGALGIPVLQYLAGAGVGRIGIVDGDSIDVSNLHRQVLYSTNDLGKSKALTAKAKLQLLNPEISVEAFETYLTPESAEKLIPQYDVIVDGTDNFETRYLINDACVLLNKPNVHGSVVGFTGTVAVFNALENGIRSANYRDIFPEPPSPEEAPSCAEAGVIGTVPSVIGSLQATEVIKLLTGLGKPLTNCILHLNLLTNEQRQLNFGADPENVLNGADIHFIFETDYPTFCRSAVTQNFMNTISATELKNWMDSEKDFQLIDVREPFETDICTIGGTLIPMGEIPANIDQIRGDTEVVLYCHGGVRSAKTIAFLENNFGLNNLYNLEGGIDAWARDVDPSMDRY